MKYIVLLIVGFFFYFEVFSQVIDDADDEAKFYAETKQVNQFFRRFNGEEDINGNRYYENDRNFQSPALRKTYLKSLFDFQNADLDKSAAKDFINVVLDKNRPQYIDFHAEGWFAQVDADFIYEGKLQQATLFLKLEKENIGTKWVITKVFFQPYLNYFISDTVYTKKFLHPMSHELDFMNLKKAFAKKDSVEQYVEKEFKPDYLTLFLYEFNKGKFKFQSVRNVKFHFFQIDNWYFEISYFNREGNNTGWLISNLVYYDSSDKKLLKDYIFYEN